MAINESIQIGLSESEIKKRLASAISRANIAMISKDDISAIAQNIYDNLNSVSESGPRKGSANTEKEEKKEIDWDKVPKKVKDEIERLKGEIEFNRGLSPNYQHDTTKEQQQLNQLLKRIGVTESLSIGNPAEPFDIDSDITDLIAEAIRSANVSDFLRLSEKEVARIADQVLDALKRMDFRFSKAQEKDNQKERENKANVKEELKKDEAGNSINDDAGDVEHNIEEFNSSFSES